MGNTSYLSQVDPNSTAFLAGEIVGAVHQIAIGFAAGSGACQVGRVIQIARTYNSVGTWVGVAKAGSKLFSEGWREMSVFDWLALAPAAGKLLGYLNRMCFVADTPVAIGYGSVGFAMAAREAIVVSPNHTEAAAWLAAGLGVVWAMQVLGDRTRESQPRRRKRRALAMA